MLKTSPGQHTLTEITTQPEAWADALRAFGILHDTLEKSWRSLCPQRVLFAGCGSTHYLSQTAAFLFQGLTGVPARACPSSEIVLFGPQVLPNPGRTLLVAISRSGTTTETLVAIDRFRQRGGQAVWAITCYPDSPLAQAADLVLPAEAAQEQSIAQTRSFASMLVLVQALAATIAGEDTSPLATLPELGQKLLETSAPLTEEMGSRASLDRFFFLGSGPHYGLANEAMLKMKEMSLSYSEAFHFLEFRHGPMSMVNGQALVVGLLSPEAQVHERQVLDEMAALGGQVLALAPLPETGGDPTGRPLPAHLPAWARLVLYLPPLQLMAYHRAIVKGLDPDHPRHLEAVVSLDESSLGLNQKEERK
jgi:glucosamine--fructose-6-phosphate aminotransferase (isomerizing)